MNEIILPARQADLPVATCTLSQFKHIQRGNKTNQIEVVGSQEVTILMRFPSLDHHLINNEVVALLGHGSDGVSHTAHGTLENRPASYCDDWFAFVLRRLEHQAVWIG